MNKICQFNLIILVLFTSILLSISFWSSSGFSTEVICSQDDVKTACPTGFTCRTKIVNTGMKRFTATCNANYECESNSCVNNICREIGVCNACGTYNNAPPSGSSLCCDNLTLSNNKCLYTNTCTDFQNTCQSGYVCTLMSNSNRQTNAALPLSEQSCRSESMPCLSNDQCCSNICASTSTTSSNSTDSSSDLNKFCLPYQECVQCIRDNTLKPANVDCCPGLTEQAGFCLALVIPPLSDTSFPYTINAQCGIEWTNTEDVLGVNEAQYWMAAFEFIFLSDYQSMKINMRSDAHGTGQFLQKSNNRYYPNSFMGFNQNNYEIAKFLFLMRNPIDNVYYKRVSELQKLIPNDLKTEGLMQIEYNRNPKYYEDMSYLFAITSDRFSELTKAYEYIMPMFEYAISELSNHYWGSYQSKGAANPRLDEPGGYNDARTTEYNICGKVMVHHSDSLCIRGCLVFSDAQTPVGTNFYIDSSTTSTAEIYRLVDPVMPSFSGSSEIIPITGIACTSNVCLESSHAENIKKYDRDNSSLPACPSNMGDLVEKDSFPLNYTTEAANSSLNENFRKIKISRRIYRRLLTPSETTGDTQISQNTSYQYDTSSDECTPNPRDPSCRWTNQIADCYIKVAPVLKNGDLELTTTTLLSGGWDQKNYNGWDSEAALFGSLVALATIFGPEMYAGYWPLVATVGLSGSLTLIGEHYKLKSYNYKEISDASTFKYQFQKLFKRYADIHFIRFNKLPDSSGQFAVNDGITLAKELAYYAYLEAFDQGDNESGTNDYGNTCHWNNEAEKQIDYLTKVQLTSSILRNFYASSYYAWKDAAACMLRIQNDFLNHPNEQELALNNNGGANNGDISYGGNVNQPNNTFGGSTNIPSAGTVSNNTRFSANSNLTLQNPGQLSQTQNKTGLGNQSSGKATNTVSSLSGKSSQTNLTSRGAFSLEKQRNEFLKRYGKNKVLMDRIKKNEENYRKQVSFRLKELSTAAKNSMATNANLASAAASKSPSASKTSAAAKTSLDMVKSTDVLKGKVSSAINLKNKKATPTVSAPAKAMEIYEKNRNNYGEGKDFEKLLNNRSKTAAGSIQEDKSNISIFDMINFSYRKNMNKIE